MTHPLTPVAVWIVRLPGPDSGAPAEVVGRAAAVDPWAAVGPPALLDEDPARLAALVEGAAGPAAVGVLGVHPVGDDEGALLEVSAELDAPDLDAGDLAALAADESAPAEVRAYARLAGEVALTTVDQGVLPGPVPRANILCLLFPTLRVCKASKKR